jgi:hypothetical protein
MKNKIAIFFLLLPLFAIAQKLERITSGLYKFSFDAPRTEGTEVTYIFNKIENFGKLETFSKADSILFIRCDVGVKFSCDRVEYKKDNGVYGRVSKASTCVYYIPANEPYYFEDQQQIFWPLKPNK